MRTKFNSLLEDLLFQPRFDHLLFAYFGISLIIRRRTKATEVRHQIAIKRKLKRFLDGQNDGLVLLRDIDDKFYPEMPPDGSRPRFRVRRAKSLTAYGLELRISMREAWFSSDNKDWDVALASWGNAYCNQDDPWNQPTDAEEIINNLASEAWQQLLDNEKAWLYVDAILPYENIIVIDDIGDDQFPGPHLLVTGWDEGYKLSRTYLETIEHNARRRKHEFLDIDDRPVKFPKETRPVVRKKWGY